MRMVLAQVLLPLIPAGTDLLLMPDGKAQAILHTLARNAKLPSLVAKKEIKSYMKYQPGLKLNRYEGLLCSYACAVLYPEDTRSTRIRGEVIF